MDYRSRRKKRGYKSLLFKLSIILCNTMIVCLVLEIGTRIYDSKPIFAFTDYLSQTIRDFQSGLPIQHDPYLGWIPEEGYSGIGNYWNKLVTIEKNGIRSNGNQDMLYNTSPVLAVGDSNTFGDEVADHETWPSILERMLGRKVINAGVFAYGLDQTFIRAKRLLAKYQPDTLIFSFLGPYNFDRCEHRVCKPYFNISENRLMLMNTPVSDALVRRKIHPNKLFRILGYSYLVHKMMMKYNTGVWITGNRYTLDKAHDKGDKVACLIFKELPLLVEEYNIKNVYVLVLYEPDTKPSDIARLDKVLMQCATDSRLNILDIRDILSAIKEKDRKKYRQLWGQHHMLFEGNRLVAKFVYDAMKGSD